MEVKGRCFPWGRAIGNHGYGVLRHNGKTVLAHRYVWEQCVGPIPEGMQVLHKCDNRACFRWDHLFLGTQKDNIQDAMSKGRVKCSGEDNHSSKLTREQVKEIRSLRGTTKGVKLAERFGVSQSLISQIKNKRYWKDI